MLSDMDAVISFHQVSVSHQHRFLVESLALEVCRGETLVLLGRSGSGKTTTLKLINQLLMPTVGEVRVNGISTWEWEPIRLRRQIGYVIQEVGLFPHFTVERNVGLVPALEGWKPKLIKQRAAELLHLVGLEPGRFAHRYPHQLSGGQRQRVGVARALAVDPPILLMDEPFGALDPITRLEIQREFFQLQERLQKTVVLVTHDIHEALMLASRIGLMYRGRLVVLETPEGFGRSPHPEAQAFLECLRIATGNSSETLGQILG